MREGLTAAFLQAPDPQFEGQTKLGNSDARTATDRVAATFNRFLLEHPDEARQIIEKDN